MICTDPAPLAPVDRRASASRTATTTTGLTVYGCTHDEAALFRVLAPRAGVLVTLTEMAPSEANAELTRGDQSVSVSHRTPVSDATLRALHAAGVRHLSSRSIGLDHVDVDYASSLGIRVEAITYSPHGVADYTVMLMLMTLRHAKSVLCRAGAGDYRLHAVRGKELRDLTVGVVGTGRIGAAVLDRLRGFGCRVLAHDLRPTDVAPHVSLDELLERSDIVTLHTPLTAQTRHLLDHRRIGRLRHGAIVVNTGRGALIDTAALLSALDEGRVGGAALDVLEGEEGIFGANHGGAPVDRRVVSRLQAMPNVLISPHIAYYTDHAVADLVQHTLVSCVDFEKENRRA